MSEQISWKTVKRKINDLIPYPNNPRILTDKQAEQLKASLTKFDLVEIPAVNTDGTIIAGHQRIKILQLLGRGNEKIDVRMPTRPLDHKELAEYNLRSNKNTGEWDLDVLANFDKEIMIDVGWNSAELNTIFHLDPEPDDDKIPEATGKPMARMGDIYQLGTHRLLCGDATIPSDIKKLIQDQRINMVFTDPPYNVDYSGSMGTHKKHPKDKILNDNMDNKSFGKFLEDTCSIINDITDGPIYICMGSSHMGTLKTAFEKTGGHWQTYIIWVKNNFTLSRADYQQMYEPILYGWPKRIKDHYFVGNRNIANVWEDLKDIKTTYDGKHTSIKFQGFEVRIQGEVKGGQVMRKKQKINIWRHDKPIKSEVQAAPL